VSAPKTPGSPYHGWYARYRQGRKQDSRTKNVIYEYPDRVIFTLNPRLHLRLIRFGYKEWVTKSALAERAIEEFLDKHEYT
jgi:hypothetical protein